MKQPYRGQAVVIVAILMVVMMGAIALSIDVSRIQMEQTRVQRAADEAALAGLTVYKASPYVDATVIATRVADIVKRNMTQSGIANVKVLDTLQVGLTTKLTVHVSEDAFPLQFGPVLGINAVHLERSAAAQSNSPVQLGSPGSMLGCDATPQAIQGYQHVDGQGGSDQGQTVSLPQPYCLSIDGPNNVTENGDPYSPLNLVASAPTPPATPVVLSNPWRQRAAFDGYDYQIVVPGTSNARITYIQVYDASACSNGSSGDTINSATQFALPHAQPTAAPRDNQMKDWLTYYRLYQLDPAGNKQGVSSSNTTLYPELNGSYHTSSYYANVVIDPGSGANPVADPVCDPLQSPFFQRWYTVAKVTNSGSPAVFDLNATTCLDKTFDCNGTEQNNYGIRAVTIDPSTDTCDPTSYYQITPSNFGRCQTFTASSDPQPVVSAVQRESIAVKANPADGASTQLFLANIPPLLASHWLAIHVFDPRADTGAAATTLGSSLQIVRPDGSYAPIEWTSELPDGNGALLQTSAENNLSNALITSFPSSPGGPTYSTPVAGTCPSIVTPAAGGAGLIPLDTLADGQSVQEDNPFDALHGIPGNCAQGGLAVTPVPQYTAEANPMPTPTWFTSASEQSYNLNPNGGQGSAVYQPYRGRWVTLYTQVPANYAIQPPTNPAPGYWYLKYYAPTLTALGAPMTDRVTIEVIDISASPKIIPIPPADTPTSVAGTPTNAAVLPTSTDTATTGPTATNIMVGAPTATSTATFVTLPPVITKRYSSPYVNDKVPVDLVFTITNPNPASQGASGTFGGIRFEDILQGGPSTGGQVQDIDVLGSTTTCVGSPPPPFPDLQNDLLVLYVPTLAAGSSCTIDVRLSYYTNSQVDMVNSTSGGSYSSPAPGGIIAPATASIILIGDPSMPVVTANYNALSVTSGQQATLTFSITNHNRRDFTNIAFSDSLTGDRFASNFSSITVGSASNTCGVGTSVTTVGPIGDPIISISIPSLATGNSCTVTVPVTYVLTGGLASVNLTNTTTAGTAMVGRTGVVVEAFIAPPLLIYAVNAPTATSTPSTTPVIATATPVFVPAGPTLQANYGSANAQAGVPVALTFTIVNPNPVSAGSSGDIGGVNFDDYLIGNSASSAYAQIGKIQVSGTSTTCSGASNVTTVGTSTAPKTMMVHIAVPNLPAGTTCTATVMVAYFIDVSFAPQTVQNATSGGVYSSPGTGGTVAPASAFLTLVGGPLTIPPVVSRGFAAPSVTSGQPVVLTYTISNPGRRDYTSIGTGDLLLGDGNGYNFLSIGIGATSTTCPAGTIVAPGQDNSVSTDISIYGLTLTSGSTCTVTAVVTYTLVYGEPQQTITLGANTGTYLGGSGDGSFSYTAAPPLQIVPAGGVTPTPTALPATSTPGLPTSTSVIPSTNTPVGAPSSTNTPFAPTATRTSTPMPPTPTFTPVPPSCSVEVSLLGSAMMGSPMTRVMMHIGSSPATVSFNGPDGVVTGTPLLNSLSCQLVYNAQGVLNIPTVIVNFVVVSSSNPAMHVGSVYKFQVSKQSLDGAVVMDAVWTGGWDYYNLAAWNGADILSLTFGGKMY